jgi:uncharacterized membrane protein/mono/diheme cytochrome c family protein
VVAAAAWIAAGADTPSRLQMLVGRLHPMVVHLPIGFLLLAVALEAASRFGALVRVRHAVPLALVLGAASAVVAVTAGYLLGESGGYEGPVVALHRRLGIGVAVASLLAVALWYAARLRPRAWLRRGYLGSLAASAALLLAAGHLGGTLTHGPDHLTEYLPEGMRSALNRLTAEAEPEPAFARVDEAQLYAHLVRPVLQARCVACHGPDKQKGDLRLDSPEWIAEGGEGGPVLVAGRPEESEMVRRIWLPESHEDAMPPRGGRPLSVVEAELVRWWIAEGASFRTTVAEVSPPAGVLALLEQLAGPPEKRIAPILRTRVAGASPEALAEARRLGVTLKPLATGSGFLQAQCIPSPTRPCGSEQVRALLPLAEQIASLHLGGGAVSDAELASIGRLPHLTRLHLERTRVTDAGLAHLAGLRHLEYLNLYGTAVSDAGLAHLGGLESLRSLYLWQTSVTPGGVDRLRRRLVRLRPSLGVDPSAIDSLGTGAASESD